MRPTRVKTLDDPKLDSAIADFLRGDWFVFEPMGGVGFVESQLQVRVPTADEPDNVTFDSAAAELDRAAEQFCRLCERSTRFAKAVSGMEPQFVLLYDYGMGGIEICERNGDELTWRKGYPGAAPAA
ncbi:MAG: hypothetical protein R3F35_16235 [Myxococcota bacterium]